MPPGRVKRCIGIWPMPPRHAVGGVMCVESLRLAVGVSHQDGLSVVGPQRVVVHAQFVSHPPQIVEGELGDQTAGRPSR